MKRITIYIVILAASLTALWLFLETKTETARESIIFFPIDKDTKFKEASTTLTLLDKKDDNEYIVEWGITSSLETPVYLRQDVSLLYSNGQLKGIQSEWDENISNLTQHEKVVGEDSSHYQSITFHYGEIHKGAEQIFSAQTMTRDELYVIDSPFSALYSFRVAKSNEEIEWKQVLDHATLQQLKYSWKRLVDYYQIPINSYHLIPLYNLTNYNNKPLFNLSQAKTNKILGQLWEGLYKQYVLGITLTNGKTVDPIGSTMPLILVSKDFTHLFVLTETIDGQPAQLIQHIN
ncbi:hypothetical protein EJF36_13690 [Bacillus sp. HMF5848]|uniref:hypothetical protein n=1 Tax=Bacillus sp. HMF5848 TaxID=2495421 RepID=UPI000F79FB90|nr:hypothetical protein [Bacillus sp. HMF5848]RSK27844.1 hypothetical protein EJF36_13690 [Bacillus sp. HMF5848]